ncbi:MAG TPA: xanthine dehydrogenase family protein molybdopterin-binding subunit [Polyangia bacterium]
MSAVPYTSRGIDRVDARAKVTGRAVYSAEVNVANLAHAVIVGSTTARGTIAAIDVARARAAPGVLSVITHANAPRLPGVAPAGKRELGDRVLQLLQDEHVVYDDQPIAVVVADTLDRARHAAELVTVKYSDVVAPEVTFDAHSPSYAPPKANRDATDSNRGDVAGARASAAVAIEATYTTPAENHNPMEMHATIAVWRGADGLTLYDASQGIFGVRKKVAHVFGLDVKNVRVLSLYVGGGFGCKGTPWSHVVLAAMAARVAGRPVKLMLTRQQMFSLVGHRPRTIQRVRLAAAKDGTLASVEHDVLSQTSRFDEFVEPSAVTARHLYACANVRTSHRLVKLDISTPTFMRAPGESSGSFALESAMDELSYAVGIDPLALRLANHAERDLDKEKPYSSKSLRACYEQGAQAFGWAKRPRTVGSMRDGRAKLGWGMATATYPSNQSAASAWASVRADGTALVRSGSQDIGTGTYTIMSQIAADALGMPLGQVRFELGDTNFPETPVSGGSQTAASVGSAVKRVGWEVRRLVIATAIADGASPLFGQPAEDIDAIDGVLSSKGEPSRTDTVVAVLRRAGKPELAARVDAKKSEARESYSLHSFGAQFVEVRVDEELGMVRVQRMVGAFAAGAILNAKTARSQFIGGMVWGIGMALHEHTVRDARTGRVVTRDLADYHVPVNADTPAIEVIMVAETDPHVSDVGAKGIGEIGITGAAAAIANAVYHATGKRIRELPITVDKLVGA